MAEEDDASKTEEPTEKKLSKAKEEGQVSQSQEIKSWATFFSAALFVMFIGPYFAKSVVEPIIFYWADGYQVRIDENSIIVLFEQMLSDMGIRVLPLLFAFMITAVLSGVFQTGMIWAPKKIEPKLSNISLKKGIKKMVSVRSVVELVKTIFKMTLVGGAAFAVVLPVYTNVEILPSYDVFQLLELMYDVSIYILITVTALMSLIAGLDFAYQRYTFMKQMKMTKQEVKDEHKQSEGDPQIKAKIRQLRMERARQRMMAAVPTSDVIVTNPTHYACALEYKQDDMQAPKLVAKGMDDLAMRIREVGEANEVPIVENPPLARALYASVEIDQEIPAEHYAAVAEVIGYVMRLKGQLNQ
ncbi:Flagellar biosynthetic protein FlhB [Candidatus Terasakiella magnetica]|uniref:Flagellar biosynthetic protein FlhB n=1 Tax=Candidatus Terasakiella magnetica TaxID=1867952 RepID=A0A1C3RKX1_9PROT|nr:flagellar biosynthesis protein FlhB [Candidatus Terasakiella magnetica]SCA57906.1 Flagellar biosynthetic protein FlhB [Candidatus Terasakiella magnetica]